MVSKANVTAPPASVAAAYEVANELKGFASSSGLGAAGPGSGTEFLEWPK